MTPYTLTARELAAFLGVSDARIRQVVAEHGIRPVWRDGRTHMYDPRDVLAVMGARDRKA